MQRHCACLPYRLSDQAPTCTAPCMRNSLELEEMELYRDKPKQELQEVKHELQELEMEEQQTSATTTKNPLCHPGSYHHRQTNIPSRRLQREFVRRQPPSSPLAGRARGRFILMPSGKNSLDRRPSFFNHT